MTPRTISIWYLGDDARYRVPATAHETPVAGLVIVEVPGRPGLLTVTHEGSGAAVLALTGHEAARDAAVRLGRLADWTLPGSLLRDLPGLGPAVRKLATALDCYGMTFGVRAVSDAELALTEAGGA